MRSKTANKEQDMILVKLHESGGKRILCLCDKNLLGKKLEEGNASLHINKSFYDGEKIGEDIEILIKSANIINAVGKESIQLLLGKKVISKEGIKKIKGIPHAQILQNL